MALAPAYETTLRHGNHAVTLRASLRAAVALDNLPGGIPGAWDSVMRQTYTGIRAVILATATDRAAAGFLLTAAAQEPLAPFLGHAQAACLDLLGNLLPQPQEAPKATTAKPITLREYLTELFKFGTTILEWPPSEVWRASPAEIDAILRARLERLEAMEAASNGDHQPKRQMSQDQRQANIEAGLDPDFDRHALRALKARHNA
ncbi:phage tail assembly chaperone (plasmid) [Paracoccus versutus]|nr:phage tail assembly chaperone [Paracoccus versutus]WEJ81894.1 phage tail assembly chaperone [Paracoccus versutus]